MVTLVGPMTLVRLGAGLAFFLAGCTPPPANPTQSAPQAETGLAAVPPASAPAEGEGWVAPDNRFFIIYPEDWGLLEVSDAPQEILAHFGQVTALVERKECFIQRTFAPQYAGRDQSEVNESVAQWTPEQVARNAGRQRTHVVRYDNLTIDGIQVASATLEVPLDGGNARFHTRQFVLSKPEEAQFYALHCLNMNDNPGEDDILALLASLRFMTAG